MACFFSHFYLNGNLPKHGTVPSPHISQSVTKIASFLPTLCSDWRVKVHFSKGEPNSLTSKYVDIWSWHWGQWQLGLLLGRTKYSLCLSAHSLKLPKCAHTITHNTWPLGQTSGFKCQPLRVKSTTPILLVVVGEGGGEVCPLMKDLLSVWSKYNVRTQRPRGLFTPRVISVIVLWVRSVSNNKLWSIYNFERWCKARVTLDECILDPFHGSFRRLGRWYARNGARGPF